MGLRAAAREAWLLPVASVVAVVRSLATTPALAVGLALVVEGAGRASRLRPLSLTAPLDGAAAVFVSPRFAMLVGGLWGAGTLLSGLLRVLFLSGALPTLGARLGGHDATRRFAPGVAWGFPRMLGTWLLAGLVDLAAGGYLLAVGVAVVRLATARELAFPPALLAVAGALALSLAVMGLVVGRVLGDVAAARAGILGEGPAVAFAEATRRFLGRPGGLTLAGISVGVAAAAASALLRPATAVLSTLADRVDGWVALGPQLMLGLFAVLAAAAVDVAWLATVGALACADVGGPEARGDEGRLSA
jgi:hypothetical protein